MTSLLRALRFLLGTGWLPYWLHMHCHRLTVRREFLAIFHPNVPAPTWREIVSPARSEAVLREVEAQ